MLRFILSFVFLTRLLPSGDAHAQAVSPLYLETFDGVDIPELPSGWEAASETAWTTSLSVQSSGTGMNNVLMTGANPGSLVSPILNFVHLQSGTLQYLARRTGTFDSLSVLVEASVDAGISYTVVLADSGEGLLGPSSAYTTVILPIPDALLGQASVRIRIRGVSSTGGNVRVDDFAIDGVGVVLVNRIGFSSGTIGAISGSDSVLIAIEAALPTAIGGLQFDISGSDGIRFVGAYLNPAEVDTNAWDVACETKGNATRCILITSGPAGLTNLAAQDILYARFTVDTLGVSGSRSDTLGLTGIIGSQPNAHGEDATVTAGTTIMIVNVAPSNPLLEFLRDTVDVGAIHPDSILQGFLGLTNPGNDDLVISDVTPSLAGLSVPVVTYIVHPGDTLQVLFEIDASLLPLGAFEGLLSVHSNAVSMMDIALIRGRIGVDGLRGDLNDDGDVDLGDLVTGIDLVLARIEVDSVLITRIDLFPFPSGDGRVDVRDLTVLVYAIASGSWPDGISVIPGSVVSKFARGSPVEFTVQFDGENYRLRLTSTEAIRAFYLRFGNIGDRLPSDFAATMLPSGAQFVVARREEFDEIGIVAYQLGDMLLTAGRHTIAHLDADGTEMPVLVDGYAIGIDGQSMEIIQMAETPNTDESVAASFGQPFPVPFSMSEHDAVTFPLVLDNESTARIDVVDLLGRRVYTSNIPHGPRKSVSWAGKSDDGIQVTPGLYAVRLFVNGSVRSTRLVVTVD